MPYVAFCAILALLDNALSVLPSEPSHDPYPERHLARWLRPELDLVRALLDHGFADKEITKLLRRGSNSLSYQRQQNRIPDTLTGYPLTDRQLTAADRQMLRDWRSTTIRDPLHWQYGQPMPAAWLAPAEEPELRVILVEPEAQNIAWLPDRASAQFWNAYQQEAEMAALATWTDIAAQVVHQAGGVVLIPPPDPHGSRKTRLRNVLRRASKTEIPPRRVLVMDTAKIKVTRGKRPLYYYHEAPTKNYFPMSQTPPQAAKAKSDKTYEFALLYQPDAWSIEQIAAIQAQTLIVVLPKLEQPELLPKLRGRRLRDNHQQDASQPRNALPFLVRPQRHTSPAEHDPGWLDEAATDAARQERWLERAAWPAGFRDSQRRKAVIWHHQGLLNTQQVPARIDWRFLPQVPDDGGVIAARYDFCVQALVWYAITTKRLPALPNLELEEVPADQMATIKRLLADLPPPSDCEPSELQFTVAEVKASEYIGH